MLHLFLVLLLPSSFAVPISEKKCLEYSDAVYSGEGIIVGRSLSAGEASSCAIEATPLIVGGTKAKEREFPHMAVIGYGKSSKGALKWLCGGSLISDLFILTAAHCYVNGSADRPRRVKLGALNLNSVTEEMQERKIVDITVHPEYKRPSKYHDIALMKMEQPVEFTPNVRPACLHLWGIPDDVDVIASGFGKTAYDDPNMPNPDLLKVQLKTVGRSECQRLLGPATTGVMKRGILGQQVCAGVLTGGKDTCQGDSGGPLQVVRRHPYCMYNLVGVTSFGRFCGFRNSPAVYTRVAAYAPWIESVVWPEEEP